MESEYYTNSTESFSPEQVNSKAIADFFQNTSFIAKDAKLMTEKEMEYNLHQMLKPSAVSSKENYYENVTEYVPRKTNPYEAIMKLKAGLAEVKSEIDSSGKQFRNLSLISQLDCESYASCVYDEIVNSKKTIDAFINYPLLNAEEDLDNNDNEDSDEEDSPVEESNKSATKAKDESKRKYYSSFERYNRLSENLHSQIKQLENDLISGSNKDAKVDYEVIMSGVTEAEDFNNHLIALEDRLTLVEKAVGKWDLIKNMDNLAKYITNLVYYNEGMSNTNDHKKRYETLKMINDLFIDFDKECRKSMKVALLYVKIIEAYHYYERSLEYKEDLNNINTRLKAIKSLCNSSAQLNETLFLLQDQVANNETKYEELSINFSATLALFKVLETMLPELEEIDKAIKSKVK